MLRHRVGILREGLLQRVDVFCFGGDGLNAQETGKIRYMMRQEKTGKIVGHQAFFFSVYELLIVFFFIVVSFVSGSFEDRLPMAILTLVFPARLQITTLMTTRPTAI